MFEEEDDALRYAGLLAAQDFPEATPESISREDGKTKETVESENSQMIFHGAKLLKSVEDDKG